MADRWTPNTADIRRASEQSWLLTGADFDRWLDAIIRAAQSEAWTAGHVAGRDYQGDGWNADAHDPSADNPYREAADV